MSAAQIIAAVRARGSEARDLRDAAHEASHALEWGAESWDRESIHDSRPSDLAAVLASEILARAVEGLVCEALNEPTDAVEARALVALLELSRLFGGVPFGSLVKAIRTRADAADAREMATQILALGST